MTGSLWGYRLVKHKWASSAFDGEGAKRFGGRWNSRGRACVYVATSESLAILEVMVHLEDYRQLEHYRIFRVTLEPSHILMLGTKDLPSNWQDDPAPMETALVGDRWLDQLASPALKVPSVIVPREFNYLLNPTHPGYQAISKSAEELPLSIDERLLK